MRAGTSLAAGFFASMQDALAGGWDALACWVATHARAERYLELSVWRAVCLSTHLDTCENPGYTEYLRALDTQPCC